MTAREPKAKRPPFSVEVVEAPEMPDFQRWLAWYVRTVAEMDGWRVAEKPMDSVA